MSKIIPDDAPILLKEVEQKDGNVTLQELYALSAFIKKYNPRTIFEIGTFNGRTTLNFAVNSSPDTVVYTLNLPPQKLEQVAHALRTGDSKYVKKAVCGELYLNTPYVNKIKQLYGDSARFDFSPYYNGIDMVFVDGAHSYNYVVNDSEIALKLIGSRKGVIIWHDSILNEIANAIHHVLGKHQLEGSCSLIKGTTVAFALVGSHNSHL